jgi:SAM-dependent methyltransferase
MNGRCVLCSAEVRFTVAAAAPDGSLRETVRCERCGCIARQRAVAALLLQGLDAPDARVYLTEQASTLFVALSRRIPRLRGSEWAPSWWRRLRLSAWLWRHGVAGWVAHGDVTALRMDDATLDVVASLDVLEHVPDYRAALSEFARVLRQGGRLLLSVPYAHDSDGVQALARREPDGSITHLQPPEYHGDPMGGGVLCWHRFGRGLLDALRNAGFREAEAIAVQDAAAGLPQAVWVVSARR